MRRTLKDIIESEKQKYNKPNDYEEEDFIDENDDQYYEDTNSIDHKHYMDINDPIDANDLTDEYLPPHYVHDPDEIVKNAPEKCQSDVLPDDRVCALPDSHKYTIYCMYCNYRWKYSGSNYTNICCPKCRNRFDVTRGKAKNFNYLAYKLSLLEFDKNE